MKKLKLIVELFVQGLIYLLAKIVPKRKHIWVFGAWYGKKYSDNSKAFFEYVTSKQNHIHAVWITKDKYLLNELKTKNINAAYHFSIRGIYYQLRSEFAFVCQALPDDLFSPAIGKKTKVVNLWHGLPLKKIMYDTFDAPNTGNNIFGKLVTMLTPYNKIRNDYLIATSQETQKTLSKAFKVSRDNTLISGFPRNDALISYKARNDDVFKCVYMPTFRGGIGDECDLFIKYGFDLNSIDEALSKNKIRLYLRMHPVNKPPKALIHDIKASKSIFFDNSEDIFETFSSYDCLITDYSGAYFDFLLMNKPILFAPFDLKEYVSTERPLYYDYKSVTLEPCSYSWDTLIKHIITTAKSEITCSSNPQYQLLRTTFHTPLPEGKTSYSDNLFQQLIRI